MSHSPGARSLAFVLGSLLAACASAAWGETRFSVRLDADVRTNAEVFDAGGRHVRTLWRGVRLVRGPHEFAWDDRDDGGRPVPRGRYDIRIVETGVTYTWEGVIGNTSNTFTGTGVFRSYMPASSLAAATGPNGVPMLYFTTAYDEALPVGQGFALAAPGTQVLPLRQYQQNGASAGNADSFVSMEMMAGDGTSLYWANTGNAMEKPALSFVAVSSSVSGAYTQFTNGQAVCLASQKGGGCYPNEYYPSVIDVEGTSRAQPTGLAVQSGSGNLLAVAHSTDSPAGKVNLFDKHSGALLASFGIPLQGFTSHPLNQIAFDANGDLWVASGKTVQCYTNLLAPGGPVAGPLITGLSNALAVAASPGLPVTVLVADGGKSQMVRAFDGSGKPLWTYGTPGGYAKDPAVSTAKLSFLFDWTTPKSYVQKEASGLAMLADGSFWVIDVGNGRLLHIGSQRQFLEQVAWRPASYSMTVDPNDTARVFSNFLEYAVDTVLPLQPGANTLSWTLVRNWRDSLPQGGVVVTSSSATQGFNTVATLSNGRTYALADIGGELGGNLELFELPASGPARDTGIDMGPASACQLPAGAQGTPTWCVMYENGDLGYALGPGTAGSTQTIYRRALQGFDATGNPLWAAPTAVATVPASNLRTPFYHGSDSVLIGPRFPIIPAKSNPLGPQEVVFFDPTVITCGKGACNNGNHLGAVQEGGTHFAWQASPTAAISFTDLTGSFQTAAIDGSVNYGGSSVWASGANILYGYEGEGFTPIPDYVDPYANDKVYSGEPGEANQVMHFFQDGSFVGEFGTPGFVSDDPTFPTEPGQAGNARSNILVANGVGSSYWYSSDESGHGGVHRWRIDNLPSVKLHSATGELDGSLVLRP